MPRLGHANGAPGTRPRVLVLTSTCPAEPGDGTPEFVLTLARELSGEFAVTILTPRVPGAARRQVIDGVEVRRFRYFPRRWEGLAHGAILGNLSHQRWRLLEVPCLLLAMLGATASTVMRHRPDLVHAHWIVPAGLVGAAARRVWRIPLVLTVHGADMFGLRARAYDWLRPRLIRTADVVTAVSDDLARALGIPETTRAERVVPMGIHTTAIRAAVGRRDHDPRRLLFVGRLVEKKGVDVLLRALAGVPDARLVVVGDGPERPRLQRLAGDLCVAGRVEFRGQQPKTAVWEELRAAGAIVIPSRVASSGDREGTPVVLAEAAAAGVPIVASAVGGLAEQITSDVDGILVPPEDVDALTAVLDKVVADPAWLAPLGERAQGELAARLDIGHTTARYRSFYRAALDHGRAPRRRA